MLVRKCAICPRHSYRLSSESPGTAWEFAAEIRCGGVTEKMWRRVAMATAAVCVMCGNEYAWSMEGDRCPYCNPEVGFGI